MVAALLSDIDALMARFEASSAKLAASEAALAHSSAVLDAAGDRYRRAVSEFTATLQAESAAALQRRAAEAAAAAAELAQVQTSRAALTVLQDLAASVEKATQLRASATAEGWALRARVALAGLAGCGVGLALAALWGLAR